MGPRRPSRTAPGDRGGEASSDPSKLDAPVVPLPASDGTPTDSGDGITPTGIEAPPPGGFTLTPPIDPARQAEADRARATSSRSPAARTTATTSATSAATRGFHQGSDLFAPEGTPLVAVQSGVLHNVGWNRLGGWRLWIEDTQRQLVLLRAPLGLLADRDRRRPRQRRRRRRLRRPHGRRAWARRRTCTSRSTRAASGRCRRMTTCRPGRATATRSPPSRREPPPVAAAQLGSTDISAASGLDTAAVLAVASGAPVDSRPGGTRRPGADGSRAAGRSTLPMTLQTALDVLQQERAPAYRARQLTHAVYAELAERWDEVTALPRPLRERLERDAPLRTLTEQAAQRAEDGTIKLQLRTHDGYPLEAVAMSHGPRRTVCLSSQSGCALACTFCATGRMGLGRNLDPRRDQRAAAAAGAAAARRAGRAHLERRDDGHGRAVPQLRQRARRDPHDQLARRPSGSARARSRSRPPAGSPGSTSSPTSRCRSSSRSRCTRPTTSCAAS